MRFNPFVAHVCLFDVNAFFGWVNEFPARAGTSIAPPAGMKQTIKKCVLYAVFAGLFGAGLVAATGNLPRSEKLLRQAKAIASSVQSKRFDKPN